MSKPYSIGKLTRTRADATKYFSYCIVWTEAGSRKRLSLGTENKVAAETLARDFWARITTTTADTVGAMVDAYLDTLPKPFDGWRGTGAADPVRHSKIKNAERKREGWKQARPYWGALRLHEIDEQTSAEYLTWRKRAANTVRHELGPIASAFTWANGKDIISKAPRIVLPAIPDSKVGHLTKEEFKQFLTGCHAPHIELFAIMAITTGARVTALLQLPWASVDMKRRIIDLRPEGVPEGALKGRPTVPINDRLMPKLEEAKFGAMTDYVIEYHSRPVANVQQGLTLASQRSGIPVHAHMFRHSAAVWMAEARVPMEEIATYLGHRNVQITIRVYARYHPDYLRRAAKELDW